MTTIYDTFHLVTCDDGILLVSLKKTDYPFIIVKNEKFGFIIMHAGEVNYQCRWQVRNMDQLDLTSMVTYYVEVADSAHWAVAIPYKGMTVVPTALYAFSGISVQKQFTAGDFPVNFDTYGSLAIVTGFPE